MKGKRSMRYRKKGLRKTRKQRAGFWSTSEQSYSPSSSSSQQKKEYGSLTSAITGSVKASTKAWNMPAAIAAMSSKLNALLIHNKVNYVFSNGFNARDYDISMVPGTGDNDGRGLLRKGAKRGTISGFQSKIYNRGSDIYDTARQKQSAQNQGQKNY
jgi:hypothetical protein